MQSDRPVFVVGCPRSGTTMLQLMLHSHQRIAVPPETRFVGTAYFSRRMYGDMRLADHRRKLAKWIANGRNTKFRELGLDTADFVQAAMLGPGSLGSVIGMVFKSYAERFGKPRWGDKRPSYYRHVEILTRLFPDAQFVHIVRDGRDCVASLKEMPWYKPDSIGAMANWAEAIDFGRRHARKLPADTFYQLRYEDLTADPEAELKKLCTFIGEDYDPAMCEPHHMAEVAVPSHKVWHSNTHQEVTTARTGSWASRLEPWEIALAEDVLGERLAHHGYELSSAPKAERQHVAAYKDAASKRRSARLRKYNRDRFSRLREPGPIAALLTDGQRRLAGLPQQRTRELVAR
ncbi:sulfotransferase family protein [Planotetraspora kaengkrachanensis]|uniref:Sulfotransferase n=1 Tax=Planotetraspora kaengkrachanensis TaxID=575193 RepID=A0A8J3PWV5_9ACTN|nr:sulfotransferase [Planotetraspora kaengkrachanensis]GIG82371.1 sulfotransferase [Planotetraspora kaengkrachanensis]